MRLFISLVLVLAVAGVALANVAPARRLSRPLVILPQESVDQPGILGRVAQVFLRFHAPSYVQVKPRYSIQAPVVPVPCAVGCVFTPIQALGQ